MLRVLLLFVGIVFLPGCIYANIETPLDTDLNQTQLGSRVGESSFQSILGLIAWGDAGTQAAAEDGGITNILHADTRFFNILGVYQKRTTIVYGN